MPPTRALIAIHRFRGVTARAETENASSRLSATSCQRREPRDGVVVSARLRAPGLQGGTEHLSWGLLQIPHDDIPSARKYCFDGQPRAAFARS
jgi:hypothetical protein